MRVGPARPGRRLRQLVTDASYSYVSAMKIALTALMILAPTAIALAGSGPQSLGVFGDWTAASYGSGGAKACYAFTAAKTSDPALPKRGAVQLTVTERKSASDEVTLAAGYIYPKSPTVTLTIGTSAIDFYTQGQTAFTTGGAAAISAFQSGDAAIAKSSAPHGKTVTDTFSLTGFSGAYGALKKACH
jgi:hypothetical protein